MASVFCVLAYIYIYILGEFEVQEHAVRVMDVVCCALFGFYSTEGFSGYVGIS